MVKSGLYRMTEGDWEWESLANGLPEEPAIRAIAVHPHNPEVVYAGTQSGLTGLLTTVTTGRR